MKLLTTTAVLAHLDPDERLRTAAPNGIGSPHEGGRVQDSLGAALVGV